MTRRYLLIFTILILNTSLLAKVYKRSAEAQRIDENKPTIDGQLDEDFWQSIAPITNFMQHSPDFEAQPSFRTEVRIAYSDHAVYVSALMHDPNPDSILTQLGNRDDWLNADYFGIRFDTYNKMQDAYIFEVTASGVQRDRRIQDHTYDAVWKSAVQITSKGWVAEMKIPYSALRFPKKDIQEWRLQLTRSIRRYREYDQWALEEKGSSNKLIYWGTLNGIKNIEAPLRLSITPYLSLYGEHYDDGNHETGNISRGFSGGMDLKYGINESFTLDMTLLPDFSQVKSDKEVKNLSAFETVHSENREFFKEAVDLFHKGGLFYSRRIGQTPIDYGAVDDSLNQGEEIIENPSKAKLINATKVSGRTKKGLGMGMLNAVTGKSHAVIKDSLGNKRKIMTDPTTNYNIMVFDQALENNSSVYLINTSVLRGNHYKNANVTGSGISLINNSNTFRLNGSGVLSQIYNAEKIENIEAKPGKPSLGYRYNLSLAKIKGNFHFNVYRRVKNDTYDINDLGLNHRNNEVRNGVWMSYRIYEPFWELRNLYNSLSLRQVKDYTTHENINLVLDYDGRGTFRNYLSVWYGINHSLKERYDYYEPREEGRYYLRPQYTSGNIGLSSDYRKPVAVDLRVRMSQAKDGYKSQSYTLRPVFRVSDKFSFNHRVRFTEQENDKGYVSSSDTTSKIIFGNRDLTTFENTFTSKYIFKNNLSLSLWMRHYWYQGDYDEYYRLTEEGRLEDEGYYNKDNDFNFNSFNIDLVFGWEFAPGSNLSLVWKNAIVDEDDQLIDDFYRNIENTFSAPQKNSLSLKVLYYLDYQKLEKEKLRDIFST
ncbi:MAG: carbohydrate binding family 9 domain-containing protein [Bacteroidales bacterium]|nr:carbohydrate binding family 9 domain-containing protein [Bacteroidales bacterium]